MKTLLTVLTLTCSYIFISTPCDKAVEDTEYHKMYEYVVEVTDAHPRCQHLATLVLLGRYSEIGAEDEVKFGQCYRGVVRAVQMN